MRCLEIYEYLTSQGVDSALAEAVHNSKQMTVFACGIASSPKLSGEMQYKLASCSNPKIRAYLSKNPCLPELLQVFLSKDASKSVKEALIGNPAVSPEIIQTLVDDASMEVSSQALQRVNSEDVTSKYIQTEKKDQRLSLLHNSNLNKDQRLRSAAVTNKSARAEYREKGNEMYEFDLGPSLQSAVQNNRKIFDHFWKSALALCEIQEADKRTTDFMDSLFSAFKSYVCDSNKSLICSMYEDELYDEMMLSLASSTSTNILLLACLGWEPDERIASKALANPNYPDNYFKLIEEKVALALKIDVLKSAKTETKLQNN